MGIAVMHTCARPGGREIASANDLSWREAETVLAGPDRAGKDKT